MGLIIKPCGQCGKRDRVFTSLLNYDGPRVVVCGRCGVSGPSGSLVNAIIAWNNLQQIKVDVYDQHKEKEHADGSTTKIPLG